MAAFLSMSVLYVQPVCVEAPSSPMNARCSESVTAAAADYLPNIGRRNGADAETHANGVAECNGSGDADMAEVDTELDYQMLFRRGREVFESMETKGKLSPLPPATYMN